MTDSGTDPKIKAAMQKLFSALKHRYVREKKEGRREEGGEGADVDMA